jgi:queuine/archaeosine tRNA-ribosyltransferase
LIGKELVELIDGYSLTQHVKSPTHKSGNILDHILSPVGAVCVDSVTVDEVGFSDHSLVKCKVAVDIKRQPIIRATFRNWKKLDLDKFRQHVRASSAYINPATTAVKFASQLETDIVSILDELAPLCTSTKRKQKPESRWLSEEAVLAKQARRRLERKWKSSGLEAV